jgi:hypothetical protein
MNRTKRFGVLVTLGALILVGLVALPASAAGTQTVSQATPHNWRQYTGGAGTTDLVNGPATPPAGTGSAHFDLPTANDFAMVRTTDYDGTLLASLTKLTYWTYVTSNQNSQAPFISLNLDYTGDGIRDDQLNFEPAYQTGGYTTMPGAGPFPDQCTDTDVNCFPKNTWVQWDALAGGWWASNDGNTGPPLDSIGTYLADHPTATIVGATTNSYRATVQQPINSANTSNWSAKSKGAIPVMYKLERSQAILGGFRVVTGNGWSNHFAGNADDLTVGVNGDDTTYNFEGVGSLPLAQGPFAPTCDLPPATIEVTKLSPNTNGAINEEPVQGSLASDGQAFRVIDCKYQYVLSIPSLDGAGRYNVEILIDGTPVTTVPSDDVRFDLK